ncbi:hypothetical protein CH063_06415 [Colletotrichum higginsianum]|uniref:Uncharacterized protein n=3 Tax=Colletotrichum destructivum species complex TaxID=2707350 RepID=H1V2G7_COLHI|nr:hypothetical protein CH63R_00329 [Colletotrichum higginsianum IMI 349063]OBR15149.1 hypothetical protein CH63R_00329 [Colletotrichum higginsianum IMI 349063]TID04973.1 hypothetical protein CH35J_003026 [Colletotrichum higginsianum]CCF34419.1 hypothetical protein CH063_06415 [Colletotrichum higginsianum]
MQLSYLYAALFLAVGATAQTCTGTLTYCTGSICNCFFDGAAEELNKICQGMGFERSLGPSRTTTGGDSRCDHQCCNG